MLEILCRGVMGRDIGLVLKSQAMGMSLCDFETTKFKLISLLWKLAETPLGFRSVCGAEENPRK